MYLDHNRISGALLELNGVLSPVCTLEKFTILIAEVCTVDKRKRT